MMGEKMGWRGKIGMILPSVQTVTEPLFNLIAPRGVAFFTSRVLIQGKGNLLKEHADMEREAFRAGRELATAEVDCIIYGCTGSGIMQGIEGDRKFCLKMEQETGIPTTSSLSAIVEALEILKLKKLVLVSPYREEMHAAEERFFQSNGFDLIRSRSMGLDSGVKFARVPPSEIYRFCRETWDERADGLFISCMNFNAMPCIGPLERDLRKPVLTSHSSALWKVLTMVHVKESISGFGRLLKEGL
jgi:maleate isomerase